MATLKTVTRTNKEYNTAYIRISHKGKADYIRTNWIVHRKGIKKGVITDHTILANCAILIKSYVDKINLVNIDCWTVQELKKYLTEETGNISFSNFARKYIDKMKVEGRNKPADNYKTALNSLESFYNKKNIYFSDITSKQIKTWIEALSQTARAKQMYPTNIKKIFEEGCLEYNDYDRNIIKITNQPFKLVKIPNADMPEKRSTNAQTIRKILSVEPVSDSEILAHDVSRLVLFLVGINTVDLYHLPVSGLKANQLCYNRNKTKKERKDKAYIQIVIRPEIEPLLVKYKGKKALFNFSERYANPDNFSRAVNKGLKSLCERAGVQKITVYWFRHTWATIAQNNCGASTELVGFCLNHTSAHKVTEGYIQKDFSRIDELNTLVLKHIFPG